MAARCRECSDRYADVTTGLCYDCTRAENIRRAQHEHKNFVEIKKAIRKSNQSFATKLTRFFG